MFKRNPYNNAYLKELVWGVGKIICVKCLHDALHWQASVIISFLGNTGLTKSYHHKQSRDSKSQCVAVSPETLHIS